MVAEVEINNEAEENVHTSEVEVDLAKYRYPLTDVEQKLKDMAKKEPNPLDAAMDSCLAPSTVGHAINNQYFLKVEAIPAEGAHHSALLTCQVPICISPPHNTSFTLIADTEGTRMLNTPVVVLKDVPIKLF